MSSEFKKKLEAYEKDELSGAELEAFEKELDKFEAYQESLEENNPKQEKHSNNDKKQKKVLRRGKWKARFQTALMAFVLFIAFTILATIFTAVYFSWGGKPDRLEVYRSIIDHTLTVTDPYGYMGGTSTNTKAYFGLEATRDLNKMVGHESIQVGELKVDFLLSLMAIPEEKQYGRKSQDQPVFTYPETGSRGMSDWNQLEDLPEGTVVSAYVSFTNSLETKQVFESFQGKNMDLLWLAVDTGSENKALDEGIIFDPIGFPSFPPIWHDNDFIVTEHTEEKFGWFGGKVVSESAVSPDYEEDDYGGVIQEQFMKTLHFLEQHESKADKLVWGELNLSEQINYLNENGFQHYGAVITGPTKEILQLQNEDWIAALEVDEVAFWNWNEQ
ncbi:sigma-M negative effector [Gracilibacillus boraciitolerans JCM 21714]|uniref:Sigma-M negative effector n=1 Tax=Gracilibacillus boraciitolerans JCM 21714 TaxID=1298598 RepID=W4VQA9_9BACI|nr:anti-sigma factor [Gracilibacillus boraciitolerans]GAE94909.1 sigma-M negative effector [Gracilibacillus boraciitolerans JCM 21714]